ncbi:hypothetical protein, partial [Enterococcus casseliflavus]|uniref:hypothetical protein n=1 Tax=Enterococcus casseliflavus TaxID=37734 RepID=UPI003D1386F1
AGMFIELGRLRMLRGRHGGAATCFRELLDRRATLPEKTRIEAVSGLASTLAARDSLAASVALMERELGGLSDDPLSVWRAEAMI